MHKKLTKQKLYQLFSRFKLYRVHFEVKKRREDSHRRSYRRTPACRSLRTVQHQHHPDSYHENQRTVQLHR